MQVYQKNGIIHLSIDEVHTTQTLELCCGKFRGLTDEEKIARVMLSVHTFSLRSKVIEIVTIFLRMFSKNIDVKTSLTQL